MATSQFNEALRFFSLSALNSSMSVRLNSYDGYRSSCTQKSQHNARAVSAGHMDVVSNSASDFAFDSAPSFGDKHAAMELDTPMEIDATNNLFKPVKRQRVENRAMYGQPARFRGRVK